MKTLLLTFLLCLPFSDRAQDCTVTVYEAHTMVGEKATVCGTVSNVHFAESSRGKPHYINMGDRFPNHAFTLVIWESDLKKFDYNPKTLEGKQLAVTGLVEEYRGKPQIIVKQPGQIVVIE